MVWNRNILNTPLNGSWSEPRSPDPFENIKFPDLRFHELLPERFENEELSTSPAPREELNGAADIHWRWREEVARELASQIVPEEMGVDAVYLFGSVNRGTAGPMSDIDILLHFKGSVEQREDLQNWFAKQNTALSDLYFERTGLRAEILIEVKIITDENIEEGCSFAAVINPRYSIPAERLPMAS